MPISIHFTVQNKKMFSLFSQKTKKKQQILKFEKLEPVVQEEIVFWVGRYKSVWAIFSQKRKTIKERMQKDKYRRTEKTATFCITKAITAKHCLYKML